MEQQNPTFRRKGLRRKEEGGKKLYNKKLIIAISGRLMNIIYRYMQLKRI